MTVKNVTIRIPPELLNKLRAMADYDGRSMNGQVLYYIRQAAQDFEREHGGIGPPDQQES